MKNKSVLSKTGALHDTSDIWGSTVLQSNLTSFMLLGPTSTHYSL